jgi:lipopolysaccharide export system protein LptA
MRQIFLSTLLLIPTATFAADAPAKIDTKQPIEITSDQLQVMQAENKAIFEGNVVAIQGNVRLKSDKMTVYYAQKAAGAPAAKAADPMGASAIKKIDVDGNVLLTTPQETASGARGDYDVVGQEIHLNENVVLTRDKNVLKGSALTYNFATQRSVMSGGAVATDGASKGKERVRALFMPKQEGK